ncbi:MAG: hypothetical protein EAZ51_02175 [Sphingobacteriales bacterium]|nr:MAG: hypothetical protein EAZ64_02220 [Sphingobacteriales bacterium]TAF82535.1 MAG: hypothetical protein EAZ51_02175 [Sphingobacteriales bacterium]
MKNQQNRYNNKINVTIFSHTHHLKNLLQQMYKFVTTKFNCNKNVIMLLNYVLTYPYKYVK